MENKLLLQDLAEAIALKEGITKKKSEAFIKALFETIEEGLETDKYVKIKGFGTFKIISVGERESVNINTGERFFIEGHEKVTFTPDTQLKDLVNRPFSQFQTVVLNEETKLEDLEKVEDEEPSIENDDDSLLPKDSLDAPEDDTSVDNPLSNEPETTNTTETSKTTSNETVAVTAITPTSLEESIIDTSRVAENEINESSKTDTVESNARPEAPNETGNDVADTVIDTDLTQEKEKEKENENVNSEQKENPENPQRERTENYYPPHNNIENNYPYVIKELDNKRKVWKNVAIILITILLLLLTYFAGYFKWFCPCEMINNSAIRYNPTIEDCNNGAMCEKPHTVGIQDSVNQKEEEKDSVITQVSKDSLTLNQESTPLKPDSTKKKNNTVNPKDEKPQASSNTTPIVQYRQVPGGKFKIVGTLRTHKIKRGETIRTIALDTYGSKGYAIYITYHNNLRDPDRVEIGTILKLPRLERRNRR